MNLFSSASWLETQTNNEYWNSPIPTERDQEIEALVAAWAALPAPTRYLESVSSSQRSYLLAYSERMASNAVRTHNEANVTSGLLALGIDGWIEDARENMLLVPLHYDAALRIGASPDRLFEQAADVLSPYVGAALRSFLKRPNKSIEAMGYSADSDEQGFQYKRDW